jgi:hypothetical protein
MNYTYRQLLEALQELSSDELDMHVTVYDRANEDYHPLNYAGKCEGDGVVDADHPIMIINDPEENVSEPVSQVVHTFPDVRSCEIWMEFADGSTLTTDDFLDMDECIETQIRDTFEIKPRLHDPSTKSGSAIVNFKWKELGI